MTARTWPRAVRFTLWLVIETNWSRHRYWDPRQPDDVCTARFHRPRLALVRVSR